MNTTKTRKAYFNGTHRSLEPEDTLAAYLPKLVLMGITRIANITGLDRIGLPVCVAIRPNARALATSQGKGETLVLAKVSAMMEAIETWHSERVRGSLIYESYTSLKEESTVVDISGLSLRGDATFYPDRAHTWIESIDIVKDEKVWIPFETISTNFSQQPNYQDTFLASSNGLASGNNIIEATVHGICEVIERDAVTLWEFIPRNEKKKYQIDLDTIIDDKMKKLIHQIRDKGVIIGVWEITSDIGIPTFTCTLVENPDSEFWRPIPMFSGHGCHLNPEIALSRAIHEAIQSRLAAISGSRDDLFPTDYISVGNKDDHRHAVDEIIKHKPTRKFDVSKVINNEFFEDDITYLIDALSKVGADRILVKDLSKVEINIPVVKVVIPKLEPFHTPFYRPGQRALKLMKGINV